MFQFTLTREQSRAIDAAAINRYGISGQVLMENAGRGVVDVLLALDPGLVGDSSCRVSILCGKGNNAGDGFVIARHLEIRGVVAQVLLLSLPDKLQGDARTNYEILTQSDVPILDLSSVRDIADSLNSKAADAVWLVDALLGTGARGEPREPLASTIRWMNHQRAQRLAVDVPSGLDCDSGEPAEPTVRADHTCTFVAAKEGFRNAAARELLGEVHVLSLGIPPRLVRELSTTDC